MKTTATAASLHTQSSAELAALVVESSKKLAEARMQKKAGKYQGKRVSLLADDLAQIKTILRKKQLEEKA